MARNNYLKPDKATLAKWVDKAFLKSLKKEIVKLGFKVCRIWPFIFYNYGWKVWS
jgi:hypothetical protein